MANELSVIVPAYNEEKAIHGTLVRTAEYLIAKRYRFEIIVVNDGSSDSTLEILNGLQRVYPQIQILSRVRNGGKGRSVKEGMQLASHPVVLFMDADNSTRIEEWDQFEPHFKNGAKAVAASRHLPGSRIVHPQPWIRRFLGAGYRSLCRALFGLRTTDFNCGFKAYDTDTAKNVFSDVTQTDWTFDVEAFILLKKKGIPVYEVPVEWAHQGKAHGLSPVRAAFRSLASILFLKGKYP